MLHAVLHRKTRLHRRYLGERDGEEARVAEEDEITSSVFDGMKFLPPKESIRFWRRLLGNGFSTRFFPEGEPESAYRKDEDWRFWPRRETGGRTIEPDMLITYRWPGHPPRRILVEMKWRSPPDLAQLQAQWHEFLTPDQRPHAVHVLIARNVSSLRAAIAKDASVATEDDAHFQAHTWIKVRAVAADFLEALDGLGLWSRNIHAYLGALQIASFDGFPTPSTPIPSLGHEGFFWKGPAYWAALSLPDEIPASVQKLAGIPQIFWSPHEFIGPTAIPFASTIPARIAGHPVFFSTQGIQP